MTPQPKMKKGRRNGKCKYLRHKTILDEWGKHEEEWCKIFKQFLVMQTCSGCPDYEEEKIMSNPREDDLREAVEQLEISSEHIKNNGRKFGLNEYEKDLLKAIQVVIAELTRLKDELARVKGEIRQACNVLGGPVAGYAPEVAMQEYENRIVVATGILIPLLTGDK
jgi:hypothetical protein